MTDVQKRAAKKTALLVFVAIALIVIISFFPFLGGYIILCVFAAMLIGGVYGMFFIWEETKEWDKRRR
jgi:uncharacterized membrane protein